MSLALLLVSLLSLTAQPYGLASRPAVGPFLNNMMPEVTPGLSGNWSAAPAFPNLVFTNALGITYVPGTNRMVVWEREGRIWSFSTDTNTTQKNLVLDISNQCQGWDDSGLLGLAFHPGFVTNRFVFIYYTWVTPGTVTGNANTRPTTVVNGAYHDRLSRFTLDANGVAVPGSEYVLVDQTANSVWHNGGGMFFHPVNGFLYWTDGDDADGNNDQVINKGLFSGVFRIDVDMRGGAISHPIQWRPANAVTTNYYIPNDNPFNGTNGVPEEFYCLGLRSPHRMTIDPPSGRIFIGDVGEGSREEIDVMEPGESGLNFQWNRIEGLNGDLTPPYIGINRRPVLDYTHAEGYAVIGGYVYRGNEFAADIGGRYIFGDNGSRTIWAMDETTTPATKTALCTLPSGNGPNSGANYTGLSSFGLDSSNELYMCQMSSVGGRIYKLARSGPPAASRPLPTLLSQTAAFTNFTTLAPNSGLIPYTVNSPLWSDAAIKTRWMALPTNTFINFAPTGEWTFPSGTVFVKHFELGVNDTNAAIRKRLETRLLVCDTNGTVYGASYRWRADNSDADLVSTSTNETITITTATGTRTQQWFYPGRQDCLRCHTTAAGGVLGVKTRQLNGDFTYPTSITDNQVRTWNHIGAFSGAVDEAAIAGYLKSVAVTNTSASLEFRVRSYLDANCSHCHRPGGVQALFDARLDTALANQKLINGAVVNPLSISGAKVVVPGDTNKSILFQRDNSLGSIQMPPLAKNKIDAEAMAVLAEWITTLPPVTNSLPSPWLHADIGNVGFAGDATYTAGQFEVSGSGDDIWNNADAGHFVYQSLVGDGQITARVVSLQNTDPWAKAGVMFRESLAAGSRHVFMTVTSGNGTAFQRRTTTDGASDNNGGPGATAPYWVRLVRSGSNFTGYVSADGSNWTQAGTISIAMNSAAYVALAVTAHNNSAVNTSVFENVSVVSSNITPLTLTSSANPTNTASAAPQSVQFTAQASGGTTNYTYAWTFGDGTNSTVQNPLHTYLSNGTYQVRVIASDTTQTATNNLTVTIGPLPSFAVKVNFQTAAAPVPAGYVADTGLVYGDRGNGYSYGWDVDNTANARYRGSVNSPDLRYDTFNHMQKPGGGTTWEMAVPNGNYQVRLVSGDPDNFDSTFRISAEGALFLNAQASDPVRFFETNGVVNVTDGKLTIGNYSGANNNKVCFIEVSSVNNTPPSWVTASTRITNGTFQLWLQGNSGATYVVEGSTNLTGWTPVFTNQATSNLIQFADPSPTNLPRRFYRAFQR